MSNEKTTCAKCGKEILWAVSAETGAKIPLDPKALIFKILRTDSGVSVIPADRDVYAVTHFATCPSAADFSGRAKKSDSGAAPVSRPDANSGEAADALDFLHRLDNSPEIEVTEWEAKFIADMFEKERKYPGRVKLFGGQVGVIEKMKSKYESLIGKTVTAQPRAEKPAPGVPVKTDSPSNSPTPHVSRETRRRTF